MYQNSNQSGIATLPTILALTILTLALVTGMAAWTLSESFVSQSQQQTQLAYYYADAGVKNALTRIARNDSYNCVATDCYTITMDSGTAAVSVSAADGSVGNPKIIISKGTVQNKIRRLQVDVSINTIGEITNLSWQELNN